MADMATPSSTGSSSQYLLGIYYDKVLLENLYPDLRMYQLADKKSIPKGIAKTVTFTKITKLATTGTASLTEGVPPDPTWLTATQITETLTQKGSYIPISDLLVMTAIDPIIEDATAELGRQAAQIIDRYLMYRCFSDGTASEADAETTFGDTHTNDWSNYYKQHPTAARQGFSTIFFSQNGSIPTIALLKSFLTSIQGSATVAQYGLTVDMVKRAVNQLRNANVPAYKDGSYVMVIHPDSELSLLRDEEFKDWNMAQYADKMFQGEIGKIAGCRFITSTNIIKYRGSCFSSNGEFSGYSGVFNILLAPKGLTVTEIDGNIHIKVKTAGSAGSVDPLDQVNTVGWKWTGTAKVLDEERGKIILTLTNV